MGNSPGSPGTETINLLKPETINLLYKSYIRPTIEYANVIWNPYFVKDINMLERIQRTATKIPKQLKNKPYEERLTILELTTHQQRRHRGDLIETFKIATNKYQSLPNCILKFNQSTRTRGHPMKLLKERNTKKPRSEFLPNRIFNGWNNLPMEVVMSTTVNEFKNELDKLIILMVLDLLDGATNGFSTCSQTF
uniref:Uncharacterized protein n=1 Tax=Cacopsylla melanoneura TaxID=428564 RepID=A0A8D9ENY2_9HEMI